MELTRFLQILAIIATIINTHADSSRGDKEFTAVHLFFLHVISKSD